MNNIELAKSLNELEKEKEKNNEAIAISDERTRMAKVNSLEYKGGTTLIFSVISYTLLIVISAILYNLLGVNAITSVFPGFSYPIALIGGSLGIGTIVRILFDKKFQIKERLKEFSTAKTQVEKLEEEIHYQIELEKANNRNRAIDETIKVLSSNQTMLNRILSRYDLNDKILPQTKEEAEEKSKELSTIIKDQYDKLDILTTQKVLHDRFWKIRQKFQRTADIMMTSMMSGMFTMFFTMIPFVLFKDVVTTNLIAMFTSLVVGTVGGSAYVLKRNNDYKKVFNNLNTRLGENALSERYEKFEDAHEEEIKLDEQIKIQIRNIILTEIQLQEYKRYLDTYITEEEKQKDILYREIPGLHNDLNIGTTTLVKKRKKY